MNSTPELVFVPTPGIGHLLSTVELAKRILQHDHRIYITILIINLPIHSAKINSYVHSQSRHNPYPTRLTFHILPLISNPPKPDSPYFFINMIELYKPLVKQAVEGKIRLGSSKPVGFVLDMFCTTMIDVADELKVHSYVFFTSGANFLNLVLHAQSLVDEHGVDVVTEFGVRGVELTVPGFKNKLPTKFVPSVFTDKEHGYKLMLTLGRGLRRTKGILINTYMELESFGIKALVNEVSEGKKIPAVYPVGPILELDNATRDGGSREEDKESIMKWLDDQPESSVVFLCFGSMGSFEAEQVVEIANGLDASGHRFLWSLRKPDPEGSTGAPIENETFVEALPESFLQRTMDRGKIIGWAPQVSILAHPAVGGFVSHCGWNSTLESIWFGVPMATWPLYAEQQLNAFELVKELGLAVEIRMDYRRNLVTKKGNFIVNAKEIEDGVKKLMSMDKETRDRVKEMGDKGREALKGEGSSFNWIGRFIEDVIRNAA